MKTIIIVIEIFFFVPSENIVIEILKLILYKNIKS